MKPIAMVHREQFGFLLFRRFESISVDLVEMLGGMSLGNMPRGGPEKDLISCEIGSGRKASETA